jgi:hypothetical protein
LERKAYKFPRSQIKKKRPMKGAKSSAIGELKQPTAKKLKAAPGEAEETSSSNEIDVDYDQTETMTQPYSASTTSDGSGNEGNESDSASDAGGPATDDEVTIWEIENIYKGRSADPENRARSEATSINEDVTEDGKEAVLRASLPPEQVTPNGECCGRAMPARSREKSDTGSKKMIDGEKRVLIEYCCEEDSQLGKKWPEARNREVLRLTASIDLTTKVGVDFVRKKIRQWPNANILLWSSIPCTGGPTWQYVNEAIWTRKLKSNNSDTRQKAREKMRELDGKRSLFRQLLHNFISLEKEVRAKGGFFCMEWPS